MALETSVKHDSGRECSSCQLYKKNLDKLLAKSRITKKRKLKYRISTETNAEI